MFSWFLVLQKTVHFSALSGNTRLATNQPWLVAIFYIHSRKRKLVRKLTLLI